MTATTLQHTTPLGSTRLGRSARARRRSEAGLSTAEYAVGTLGACSIAGILLKIASSDWFADIVRMVVETALKILL